MNVKLKVLTAGVLFFTGQALVAQEVKTDSTSLEEKKLDEVVVVGYTKRSQDKITSAVTVVSSESLNKFSSSTMGSNALQGKVAGMEVTALNGKPGSGSAISIRGLGNVTASVGASNPLFVIDGFIVGNDENALNIFNSISPNDYENISVLKDAAAAAIYGSQGANGVVVLTTKSGKSGKPVITLKSTLGFSNKIKDKNFRMMNSAERIEYNNRLAELGIRGYQTFTPEVTEELLALDHNWQRDILRTSFIESYLANIRAGSDKMKYTMSLGYDSDNGIIRNIDAYKRYTGRVKIDATPTERFALGSAVGISYSKTSEIRDRNNIQNPIRAMYDYLPYEPVYEEDGSYNLTPSGYSILEALLNNPENVNRLVLDGNIYGQYNILEGLTFKSQLGGYFSNVRGTAKSYRDAYLSQLLGSNGSVTQTNNNRFKYVNTNTLQYVKSFGNHNFDLMGLVEYSEYKRDYIRARAEQFSSPLLSELSNASKKDDASGFTQKYRTFSYGGFLNYDYAGKYLFTGSVRRDADSRFGKNNVYSDPFWSVSLAWNVTKENFLASQAILSNLKLRASVGTRGYNNIDLNLNNVLMSGSAYGDYPTLVANNTYGNPDLKWEIGKSSNLGAEFGFFNNRITGTFDYFVDDKNDFLFNVTNYSTEGGTYATTINSGNLRNSGLELSLNAQIIKSKDFNWSVRFNGTYSKNVLRKLANGETEKTYGINMLKEGEEPWTFYLVRSIGVNPENGNEVYLDKDGNPTEIYSADNAVPLSGKSPLPKYFGGFGTTISYKGFDLSADFSYKYGNYTYNYMARNMLNYTSPNSNLRTDAGDFWTTPGQTGVLPRPANPNTAPGGITGIQASDRFLQNASFLRLRNVSVGYTFDKKHFSDLPVNKVRLSLTGQNLATWTKFEGDPEVSIGSGENQTGAGQTFISGAYALYSYPNTKTFLFGIEVEF